MENRKNTTHLSVITPLKCFKMMRESHAKSSFMCWGKIWLFCCYLTNFYDSTNVSSLWNHVFFGFALNWACVAKQTLLTTQTGVVHFSTSLLGFVRKELKASWCSTYLVWHGSFNVLLLSPSGIKPCKKFWRFGKLSKKQTLLSGSSVALLTLRTEKHLTTHKFSIWSAHNVNRALEYCCRMCAAAPFVAPALAPS